jgi:hypothetical protein
MFPLIAVGGAIGAAFSIAQGASWLADKLGSDKAATSAGGKADARPQAVAKGSAFEAALTAQAAGQVLPAGSGNPVATGIPSSAALIQPPHGTDYDALARMKAGILAYGHAGERRDDHAVGKSGSSEDQPVVRS